MQVVRLIWLLGALGVVSASSEEEDDEDEDSGGTSPAKLLVAGGGGGTGAAGTALWANARQSALRPRKRDLHEERLAAALGADLEPAWMRTSRPAKPPPVPTQQNNSSRVAIQLLEAELASLPVGPEAAAILLERATCPLRFVWKDLGPDFWPRWLRTAYCPQPPPGTPSCSWPPGMACAPGPHRHLHVLRWHCRLRKNSKRKKNDNNVWGSAEKRRSMMGEDQEGGGGRGGRGGGKKRSKYRCLWVKVPYPVAEDCICSCA